MKNKILTLIAFLILLPAALFAWGNGRCALGGQFGHMVGGFYGGGIFMGIVSLVILGALLFFAVKYFKSNGQLTGKAESPLEVLKVRYAKGEITKEEFESLKKDLGI